MMDLKVNADLNHNAGIPASFNLLLNPLTLYHSIFTNPSRKPGQRLFKEKLNGAYGQWAELRNYVSENRPGATETWHYYKVGWHIRVMYNNRAVIYCIPSEGHFHVFLVLGEKAMQEALASSISAHTKQILSRAAIHSEGFKCYLKVDNEEVIKDIKKLLAIKLFIKT